jgi:hypothetical protein
MTVFEFDAHAKIAALTLGARRRAVQSFDHPQYKVSENRDNFAIRRPKSIATSHTKSMTTSQTTSRR